MLEINNHDLLIYEQQRLRCNIVMSETPKIINDANKPLNSEEIEIRRVDINVLKARAKAVQDKENFKNTVVIIFFLLMLGVVGIYFSV